MNGRITEHIFYSFFPKLTVKARQRIRKARSSFLSIPQLNYKRPIFGLLHQIPQPHHRIQTQTQRSRSFGPFALVSLWLLATHKLFVIFERILDCLSVVVTFKYPGCCHRHRICHNIGIRISP